MVPRSLRRAARARLRAFATSICYDVGNHSSGNGRSSSRTSRGSRSGGGSPCAAPRDPPGRLICVATPLGTIAVRVPKTAKAIDVLVCVRRKLPVLFKDCASGQLSRTNHYTGEKIVVSLSDGVDDDDVLHFEARQIFVSTPFRTLALWTNRATSIANVVLALMERVPEHAPRVGPPAPGAGH